MTASSTFDLTITNTVHTLLIQATAGTIQLKGGGPVVVLVGDASSVFGTGDGKQGIVLSKGDKTTYDFSGLEAGDGVFIVCLDDMQPSFIGLIALGITVNAAALTA
jgi:hypothetical protein